MNKGYVKIPIERYDELIKKEKTVDEMTKFVKENFNKLKSEVTETWSILKEEVKE